MENSPIRDSQEFTPVESSYSLEGEFSLPTRLEHGDVADDESLIKGSRRNRPNRAYENIEDIPAFRPSGRAACAGIDNPEIFSTGRADITNTKKAKKSEDEAKAICAACLVRLECLDYALKNKVSGIWGGLNEAERRAMNKRPLK